MKTRLLRSLLWLFTRLFYRVTVLGAANVPSTGGALLVSNHVSFVDMPLILCSTTRLVRFVLPSHICRVWWLRPWLKLLRVIPLPDETHRREMLTALHQAVEAIRQGDLVGIFAEGSISRIGIMLPFTRAFERLLADVDAPIIPVCLDGLWGSIFSYQARRFFWKTPRRLPYPVAVNFGKPMPPKSSAFATRTALQDLCYDAWPHRRRTMRPLGRAFVHCARRHPLRFAMADSIRVPKMSWGTALVKTVFLARRLEQHWREERMVGIFLPSSATAALVNLAALLAGKVPVNLNYTLSSDVLAACTRQCDLKTIITSETFLEKTKAVLPVSPLFLEQLLVAPRALEKLVALALAWLGPVRLLEKALGCHRRPELDDLATVVFSSGSTGMPKGVMLSHYNLISNVQQLGQVYEFAPDDRFLGILPLFHSFGFTATLAVPAVLGIGVVFHPDPRDGKRVAALATQYRATYLMATPTFLRIYLRSCEPELFGSLHFIMAGAEKLQVSLANEFEEKFGIRPVEGYGCTECSPVIAANRPDYRACRYWQPGSRHGKIGHPMPGMSVRIVQPETREPLPTGQDGLLLVRGPNVMMGYLGCPEKTAEVLQDGWYNTGDIARMDENGFLEIKGRLSRFAKIGGEMVPLDHVQEKLHELARVTELTFGVAAVPDEARGERLVVLHTFAPETLPELLKELQQSGLPNLWIPKPSQFFPVEQLPLVGPMKLGFSRLRELAIEISIQEVAERKAAA